MVDADMLEHADRHDAVETLGNVAVVLDLEMHMVVEALGLRALGRDRMLFGRERHAEHLGLEGLGEVEPEPAPARADVEHALARLHLQLGGDMALLGGLRLLERHVGPFEIGAGILHVVVEEELVELAREIVVALDVALGAAGRVHLMQAAEGVAQRLRWPSTTWHRCRPVPYSGKRRATDRAYRPR